ncbi:TniQ family protein [Ralstonia pseudosolanacearum]|uniref:TniQ family protein n=1 Tax=Ralstonia pseudosolanacearum TaxID=1310165 RepID=UPI002674A3BD|nr:TniQ family protein [Ralstonia pseudosolanacearum]
MTPFADWPVRPRAKRGESLAGYVYRVHSYNGHSLSPSAYQLVKACYCGTQPSPDIDEETIISGLCVDDFDRGAWNLAWQSLWWSSGLYIVTRQPRRTGLQACPSCIREMGFHRRFWDLPWVRACPLHRCMLLTHCNRCGEALNWKTLNPDWKHQCGQSLLDEVPHRAIPSDLGIAEWLSGAVDAPPYETADKDARLPERTSLTLEMKYKQLAALRELRRVVIDKLLPAFSRTALPERRADIRRRGPNQWELKLVHQGHTGLRDVLKRWALRYVRQLDGDSSGQPALLRLSRVSDEVKALNLLSATCDELRQPLSNLLDELALQMPFEGYVLFNPRIADVDKTRRLQQFRRWWLALCLRVRSQQEQDADSDSLMWLKADDEREQEAVDILNAAFRISALSSDVIASVTVFAPLVCERTWSSTDSPEGLLRRVAVQLMSVPDTALKRVACDSLALVAELEGRQR